MTGAVSFIGYDAYNQGKRYQKLFHHHAQIIALKQILPVRFFDRGEKYVKRDNNSDP